MPAVSEAAKRHQAEARKELIQWYKDAGCPFIVVANKLDKLKKSEIEPNIARVRETLELDDSVLVIPFSAEKGTGRDELVKLILAAAGE